MTVKLNVSASADGTVGKKRHRFDAHLNNCARCRATFCPAAERLWRDVCVAALLAHRDSGPVTAEDVVAGPVIEQHPATSSAMAGYDPAGDQRPDFATAASAADWAADHPSTQEAQGI